MLNVLMPLGGKSNVFSNSGFSYPKLLIEIDSKPMIEHVIDNINTIDEELRYIFVINKEDEDIYHLGNVLKLLTDESSDIVVLQGETKGASCSALMAVEFIGHDQELIICNGDQLIDIDLNEVLDYFRSQGADAGIIHFEAVHPRWAFAHIEEGQVVETAEKKPISKNAIAGFYYYRKGSDFVKGAMGSIRKNASVNGLFYMAPVLNELVLEHKKIMTYKIDSNRYYTFNSPDKVESYRKC